MIRMQTIRLGPPPASRGVGAMLAWVVGMIAGGVALVLGAMFAVFTALVVAFLALLAGLAVWAARLMRGRRPSPAAPASAHATGPAADAEVIDARKVGDQWVAYGFDSQAR